MTKTLKKTFVGALVVAFGLFGLTSAAQALTQQELLSQALDNGWSYSEFMSAYEMTFGSSSSNNSGSSNTGSTSCGTTYGYTASGSTLTSGMNGAAVSALQAALNTYGGASLVVDGAYGPATSGAVSAFQMSQGLAVDGVAGPMTQGALVNASMTTTPCEEVDDNDDNDNDMAGDYDLDGNVGSATYELVSQYSGEEVGEGEEDVVVAGLRVEAGNDSDIMISSLKLNFIQNESTVSSDLDDYAEEIKVWFDGEEVGSLDADDFDEQSNNSWEATIVLDDGVIIDADQEDDILVSVTALNNLDSGDISGTPDDDWDVDFRTIRFVDGDGVVTSEDAGQQGSFNPVAFDFADFATAQDIEMKVTLDNDNPEATIVEVDTNSDTDNVELLIFEIEAEGTDIEIEDLPVFLTAAGANVDEITGSLTLEADGEEWTESVSASATTATITFDNIDFTIDEGDTVTFTVMADINDLGGNFEEGDTLKAELRSFEVDAIDADDALGDNISDDDANGTALGEAMAFYETGIRVSNVDLSAVLSSNNDGAGNDTGTFAIEFDVEAFGGTVYISDTAAATTASSFNSTATSSDNLYRVVLAGTATTDGLSDDIVYTTSEASESAAGQIELAEGEMTTVTVTITKTNDLALETGLYRTFLEAILWNSTDATDDYNVYDFDFEDYYSGAISIN